MNNRIGKIKVTRAIYDNDYSTVLQILKQVKVITLMPVDNLHESNIEIVGYCKDFKEVTPGESIPEYQVEIERQIEDIKISFKPIACIPEIDLKELFGTQDDYTYMLGIDNGSKSDIKMAVLVRYNKEDNPIIVETIRGKNDSDFKALVEELAKSYAPVNIWK